MPAAVLQSLPPKDALFASIDSFYAVQAQAELPEFQESRKGEWLKFLPSLGITYTLDGRPRPSIGYSTNIIYNAKKTKQQKKLKRLAILQQSLLEAEKIKAEVAGLITEYELLLEKINFKKEILEIDRQLFEIEKVKYERLELAPSDFLKIKRAYLLQLQSLLDLEQQIPLLEKKIRTRSGYLP